VVSVSEITSLLTGEFPVTLLGLLNAVFGCCVDYGDVFGVRQGQAFLCLNEN